MDSQFAGGPLPPDKHAKDVPFLDKYALERWEVGCLLFCVPMIFDCQKHYYLVVCLTTILRVPVIILTLINLHSTIFIFLYNQLKFTDMFQSSVLTFQCVLHFMVGSTEGTEGVSKDIIDVLLNAGLMTM